MLSIPVIPSQPAIGFQPQAPRMPVATSWQPSPMPMPAAQPAFPVNAAMAGNATRQPTFRAQAPDPPAPALVLPTPEALGLVSGNASTIQPATAFDWNDARTRLRRIGAVGFHLDEVAAGQWRATLLLPVGEQQTRHVEASAGSDAAAVAAALQQAEALAATRR